MKSSLLVVAAVLAMSPLIHSQTDDLAGYQPCEVSGLKIVQTDRLPARPMTRTVKTADGDKPTTMMDGWRVLYLLLPSEPMLNLKFEKLSTKNWNQQKVWLIDSLRELAKDDGTDHELRENTFGHIHSYTLTRKSLEGGVLSISELFDDQRNEVMTVYYLNNEPADRQFQSMKEFEKLRDRIAGELGNCMDKGRK